MRNYKKSWIQRKMESGVILDFVASENFLRLMAGIVFLVIAAFCVAVVYKG